MSLKKKNNKHYSSREEIQNLLKKIKKVQKGKDVIHLNNAGKLIGKSRQKDE